MFNRYYAEYETDGGKIVPILIKYSSDKNPDERFNLGKFGNVITAGCKRLLNRTELKPRKIDHSEYGDVYFKTHQDWLDFISNNKDKVKSYDGEKLSCTAIYALYP